MKRTATQWRNRLDKLFSLAVRARGKCERCGRFKGVKLETAHIYTRSYKEGRWLFLNIFCLCSSCHRWTHDRPLEFAEFIIKKLGKEDSKFLMEKIRPSRQWSEEDYLKIESLIEEEIKKLT